MSQSLEWRLARTFVRCYSLVLLIGFSQATIGPIFGFWITGFNRSGLISPLIWGGVEFRSLACYHFHSNCLAGCRSDTLALQ